jgi:hypothetical protein
MQLGFAGNTIFEPKHTYSSYLYLGYPRMSSGHADVDERTMGQIDTKALYDGR